MLKVQHGPEVKERFLKRLVKEIEVRGTLDVLRRGVMELGSKSAFQNPIAADRRHRTPL